MTSEEAFEEWLTLLESAHRNASLPVDPDRLIELCNAVSVDPMRSFFALVAAINIRLIPHES